MRWLSFEVLECAIFLLLAFALVLRVAIGAYRFRENNVQVLRQRLERWQQRQRWLTSGIFFLLVAIGFLWMGTTTAVEAYRWKVDTNAALHQKMLPLDLHIPNVSPDRTYTVVARFRIHGKPYASRPLHIKFGEKKPAYQLTLYYDPKNPARNAWTKFQIPSRRDLNRAVAHAIGFMFFGILLLNGLEFTLLRRRIERQMDDPSMSANARTI